MSPDFHLQEYLLWLCWTLVYKPLSRIWVLPRKKKVKYNHRPSFAVEASIDDLKHFEDLPYKMTGHRYDEDIEESQY